MKATDRTEYIIGCLREAGSMYPEDARAFLAEHDADRRAEVLREAADTQWTYAREHWRPADGDSHSAVAKKERKFGAAERLICLIDPEPPILLPRAVRVLPHEDGFIVRWQVGEESKSTWRPTRSGADAAADDLRRMANAGQAGKDIPAGDESTRAAVLVTCKVCTKEYAPGQPCPVCEDESHLATAPDFFQPDRTYTRRDGTTFQCFTVTTTPWNGRPLAIGWHTDLADVTSISWRGVDEWRHEYDGCQPPADDAGAADEDEWVRCSHLHCPNSERYARATERGWTHHHMDTWRCTQHPLTEAGESRA